MIFDAETIVACCTSPAGTGGALAIIRISGPSALTITDWFAHVSGTKKNLVDQQSHTIHYGFFADLSGKKIDEVMYAVMRAPRTFTGEDTVEITCHNNPFIVSRIIALLLSKGARLAGRGEFTRQAVLNKRIDLIQAEAVNGLIHATTEQAVEASLAQLGGTFSHAIAAIERRLISAIAWCEASFEFVDEVGDFGNAIKEQLTEIIAQMETIDRAFSGATRAAEGVQVVLVGAVNAGKSSLFNLLVGRERAIVSPTAGTTRDTIEARVSRSNITFTFVDTAGLRNTTNDIEQQGILRSWQSAESADLVILVIDRSRTMTAQEHRIYDQLIAKFIEKIIIVHSKVDLAQALVCDESLAPDVQVSTKASIGVGQLENLIQQKLSTLLQRHQAPYIVNQRHHAALVNLQEQLKSVMGLFAQKTVHYELVSDHLQRAVEMLGEMTGKTVSAACMDQVFREFCIGK